MRLSLCRFDRDLPQKTWNYSLLRSSDTPPGAKEDENIARVLQGRYPRGPEASCHAYSL